MDNSAERYATAHYLLIGAEEDAIAEGKPLNEKVSKALDLLADDAPVVPAYTYRATGARIIDGDTFIATVDLGFRVSFSCNVRLHGVNTPEKGKPGAQAAAKALEELTLYKPLLLRSYQDARSFERWICDVWNVETAVPINVSDRLIADGKGVPFQKGDKWTR